MFPPAADTNGAEGHRVGGRSEFFLQPLEYRRLLSGAAAPEHAATKESAPADSAAAQVSPQVVEQQVAQLKSALSEMADRMAAFEKLLDSGGR
jgi:hypothetical protein